MTLLSLHPGTLFAGRYRIIRCIAQGGMGAVYEVVHLETERRRALKVMLANMLQSQEMRERFRQEARVTANIESEFLVDVFDAGIDEETGMPFLVMELLRGEELYKRLKRVKRFTFEEVVTFLHQASLALDKTHKASVVHRDLKPGNLFLTERDDGSPRIKVLDFGIAKLVAENSMSAEATRNLGTPIYMAPEQFQLGRRVSPASDIYALGMISFTFLVGTPYWADEINAGANVFAFAAAAVLGPQESACARAQRRGVTLPPEYDTWFRKITSPDPANRFLTASSAVYELAEVLGVPLGNPRRSQYSIAAIDVGPPPAYPPAPSSQRGGSAGWSSSDSQRQAPSSGMRTPDSMGAAAMSGASGAGASGAGAFGVGVAAVSGAFGAGAAAPSSAGVPGPAPTSYEAMRRMSPQDLAGMGTPTSLASFAPGQSVAHLISPPTPMSARGMTNTPSGGVFAPPSSAPPGPPSSPTGSLGARDSAGNTTSIGVTHASVARPQGTSPVLLIAALLGISSVLATVAVVVLRSSDPEADAPAAQAATAAATAAAAPPPAAPLPLPSVEPASPDPGPATATSAGAAEEPLNFEPAPAASAAPKATSKAAASKPAATSKPRTTPAPTGAGAKRPAIYSPD
jgi:serine/threonine-protein kinase